MPFVFDNLSDFTFFDDEKLRYMQSLNKKWSDDIAKPMKPKSQPDTSDKLQLRIAELLDSYFPEHKDCECSSCLAFIYGLKETVETVINQAVLTAQIEEINKFWKAVTYAHVTPTIYSLDRTAQLTSQLEQEQK